MFIVIGGGKFGSFLAEDLAGRRHGVVLIERSRRSSFGSRVNCPPWFSRSQATAATRGTWSRPGSRAAVFAVVTGEDAGNLAACQLARVSDHVRVGVGLGLLLFTGALRPVRFRGARMRTR